MSGILIDWQPETWGVTSSWAKHVTGVADGATDGHGLHGTFLRAGEVELPVGAIVVEVCTKGSHKHPRQECDIYRVRDDLVAVVKGLDWSQHRLSCLRAIREALAGRRVEVDP